MADWLGAPPLIARPVVQAPTTTDGGLEKWPDAGSAANIGIMLFRPSAEALAKVGLVHLLVSVPVHGFTSSIATNGLTAMG